VPSLPRTSILTSALPRSFVPDEVGHGIPSGANISISVAGGLTGVDFALDAVRLLSWASKHGSGVSKDRRSLAQRTVCQLGVVLQDEDLVLLSLMQAESLGFMERSLALEFASEFLRLTWSDGKRFPRWANKYSYAWVHAGEAGSKPEARHSGEYASRQETRLAARLAATAARYGHPKLAL